MDFCSKLCRKLSEESWTALPAVQCPFQHLLWPHPYNCSVN